MVYSILFCGYECHYRSDYFRNEESLAVGFPALRKEPTEKTKDSPKVVVFDLRALSLVYTTFSSRSCENGELRGRGAKPPHASLVRFLSCDKK